MDLPACPAFELSNAVVLPSQGRAEASLPTFCGLYERGVMASVGDALPAP